MNCFRRAIAIVLLIGIFFQPSNYAAAQNSNKSGILLGASKVALGIGLALGAHIMTELPIIVAHEYGHHIGNHLSGGNGGKIRVECNLHKHPVAVLMPFFAFWGSPETRGNELVIAASGPLVGIGANYAIMFGANSIYALKNGGLKKEALKSGLTSPLRAYKDISDEIAHMIVAQGNYQMLSFSETFMMTFNLLRTSKMVGEFLYGLTPISIDGGDGHDLWREIGLKRNCTVKPLVGLFLAIIPAILSITFGIAKGVHLRLKSTKVMREE